MAKVKVKFDAYRKNARRSSNKWATSDRGWMHVNEICYGHYLDYGGLQGYPAVYVHAVMFDRLYHSYYASSVHHRVKVCNSVQEAQAWMQEEIKNNVGHMKQTKNDTPDIMSVVRSLDNTDYLNYVESEREKA